MRPSLLIAPSTPLLLLVSLVLAAACTGEPRRLGWELEFEDPAHLARSAVVEGVILRGGCEGEEIYTTEIGRGALEAAPLPRLADGRYGFAGRGRDDGCTVFAEGCIEVDLPIPGPVVVVMTARAAEAPACSTTFCQSGFCGSVPVDGGVEDACTPTETICDDAADDDCDGDFDCDDSDCVGSPACEACVGVTCGACELCRAGLCEQAPDETLCAGGACWEGACCTSCWDGFTCRAGDTQTNCGSGGERCQACEGCGSCTDGACAAEMPDDTPCAGGSGLCNDGVCCSGCADAAGCEPGNTASACGLGGLMCVDCGECAECGTGLCAPLDDTPCGAGTCRQGTCCDGCWDAAGMTCEAGTEQAACGVGGAMCNACNPCERCDAGTCVSRSEGDSCTSPSAQPGVCWGAALVCCAGCWDGASCVAGDTNAACGDRGVMCQPCGSRTACNGRFCEPI